MMVKKINEKCPCCSNKNIWIKYRNMDDKLHFVDGNFLLLKCINCGLEFISPLLNEKELIKYYPKKDYYSFNKQNNLALKYHKLSAKYYLGKNHLIKFLLYPLKPFLCHYYGKKGDFILEIGCGNGLQLSIYKKYGKNTYGIEPYGPKLTEKDKLLGISRKSLKDSDYSKNQFDYIILREVLEHIPNQKEVLTKCYEWLKPEGKLIITIPNTKSLWNQIFKKNWYGYDVPRHLYNYNPENIKILLKNNKFKIDNLRIYDLPYMLHGSIKFKFKDKNGKFDKSLFKIIFAPISLLISYFKKGSLMEIRASKIN